MHPLPRLASLASNLKHFTTVSVPFQFCWRVGNVVASADTISTAGIGRLAESTLPGTLDVFTVCRCTIRCSFIVQASSLVTTMTPWTHGVCTPHSGCCCSTIGLCSNAARKWMHIYESSIDGEAAIERDE